MITETDKDKRLQRDIKILINGVLESLPRDPEAILLSGGYGRDEGAWYEDDNGNATPYNDYDLTVITEMPMSRDTYNVLRKRLADEVGIKWIDISCYTPSQIQKMKPSIGNIDLFYASKVVWGNKEWDKYCPKLRADKIKKKSIVGLYITRMWTLLGAFEGCYHDLGIEESRFFCNQMAKAILAACDMRLIALHQYNSSYKVRVQLICNLFHEDGKLVELSKWALHEKMNPSSSNMSESEVRSLYKDSYLIYMDSFNYAIGKTATYFKKPTITQMYLWFHTLFVYHVIKGIIKGEKLRFVKKCDIMRAQNYVLRAYSDKDLFNETYINKASDILIRYGYITQPVMNWHKIRESVAFARNNI